MEEVFTESQLQAIADALADTSEGLTGSEIERLLQASRMADPSPAMTKRHRLFNAFVVYHNQHHDRLSILAFIRKSMKPERYARTPGRYEIIRANLNRALVFAGLAVEESGNLVKVERAETLTDAARRAAELAADLEIRNVHPDVLRFCRAELLVDNYFHAVLEATKSVADKLRHQTGVSEDGALLVDRTLGGDYPALAINALENDAERSEQRGFANIVKGAFGMFRNPMAHAPKLAWAVRKQDAEDALSLLSMIHKRLDLASAAGSANLKN